MLRNAFIVFIGGWIIWFWMDKPRSGLDRFLQADNSMLVNFQRAFDMLKSGYPDQSFIYIWNAHYLVLSLFGGIMLTLLFSFISTQLARKRMRSRFILPSSTKQKQESNTEQQE